jgi:hypothetical protein
MTDTANSLIRPFRDKYARDVTIKARISDFLSLVSLGRLDLASKKILELEQHMKIRRAALPADERCPTNRTIS